MKQDETELDDKQLLAIDLLLAGAAIGDIAAEVGCSRTSVWRWRTGDKTFAAELNKRRKDLHAD